MKQNLSLNKILTNPNKKLEKYTSKLNMLNHHAQVTFSHIRSFLVNHIDSSPLPSFGLIAQSHNKVITKTKLASANKLSEIKICKIEKGKSNILRSVPSSNHKLADAIRLKRASWAFTTRRVNKDLAHSIAQPKGSPNTGDLVLARVDTIGHHAGLQLAHGRRKVMFEGNEIVVAYGNRYASSQFEALLPETMGPCHLVAGGGVASRAISWHNKITKGPTHITPIGLLLDANGQRMNLNDFAIKPKYTIKTPPITIAVVGTSMDSGKTQTAAYFARGLIANGLKVGYAKITGTGAGGDTWLLIDAGASPVLDFTDAGMATTYMATPEEIECILITLVDQIAQEGVDAIILEIADGVFQRETAALLQSPVFNQLVGGMIVAARDSMGASAGVNWLNDKRTSPVLALSGVISSAPLQAEEAKTALNLPVYDREDLATASTAINLLDLSQLDLNKPSHKTDNTLHAVH